MLKDKIEKILSEYNYNNIKFVEHWYDEEETDKIIEYVYSGYKNNRLIEISIVLEDGMWNVWDRTSDSGWMFIESIHI